MTEVYDNTRAPDSVRRPDPDPLDELLDRVAVVRLRLLDIDDNEALTLDGRDSLQAAFIEITRAVDLARIARCPSS
jgi:hypothetical protein